MDITLFFFFFFCFFKAAPAAYGGSQARGSNQSFSCWPTPQPQQCRIQAVSVTDTTALGNSRSLTLRARSGIEPATSWFLVGFVSAAPPQGLLDIVQLNRGRESCRNVDPERPPGLSPSGSNRRCPDLDGIFVGENVRSTCSCMCWGGGEGRERGRH